MRAGRRTARAALAAACLGVRRAAPAPAPEPAPSLGSSVSYSDGMCPRAVAGLAAAMLGALRRF